MSLPLYFQISERSLYSASAAFSGQNLLVRSGKCIGPVQYRKILDRNFAYVPKNELSHIQGAAYVLQQGISSAFP